jgi:hypothetical protein
MMLAIVTDAWLPQVNGVITPIDVVNHGHDGVLDYDLTKAVLGALELDRAACRQTALERTWDKAAGQFMATPRARPPRTRPAAGGRGRPGLLLSETTQLRCIEGKNLPYDGAKSPRLHGRSLEIRAFAGWHGAC